MCEGFWYDLSEFWYDLFGGSFLCSRWTLLLSILIVSLLFLIAGLGFRRHVIAFVLSFVICIFFGAIFSAITMYFMLRDKHGLELGNSVIAIFLFLQLVGFVISFFLMVLFYARKWKRNYFIKSDRSYVYLTVFSFGVVLCFWEIYVIITM
jgi:hypothetical protein